jgi:hypothetical protein
MADGSVNTLTNPITGTGTTNYVPKFTGANTIGNSNLINDASGNLGLGVTPSAWSIISPIMQFGTGGAFIGAQGNANVIRAGVNAYFNGSNWIYTNTDFASYYETGSGAFKWFTAPSGTAGNAISFTQAMTLFANGNLGVGVGGTDAGYKLDVNGTGRFSGSVDITGTGDVLILRKSNNVPALAFIGNSTNKAVIEGGDAFDFYTGNVSRLNIALTGGATFSSFVRAQFLSGENSTSGSPVIQGWNKATSGDNKFIEFYTEGGGGTLRGSIDYNRAGGAVRYNTTSDSNLKNIIGDSDRQKSIDILNLTKIREYSWKDDKTNKPQIGVIAQELYEIFKGAVSKGSDNELFGTEEYKEWAVDKTAFTFHLIAGFQEHERIIKEQQAQIEELKALTSK